MNKVLAQSDDIDDIEMLEAEKEKQEKNRLQKNNLELREQNSQYQLANVELRKRLEEVNGMLKDLKTTPQVQNVSSDAINPNEQQISYGKNVSSLIGESPQPARNIPGQSSASFSRKEDSDGSEEAKNAFIEHIKGTIVMILKRMPEIDKMNEQVIPILFSLLNMSQQEI